MPRHPVLSTAPSLVGSSAPEEDWPLRACHGIALGSLVSLLFWVGLWLLFRVVAG